MLQNSSVSETNIILHVNYTSIKKKKQLRLLYSLVRQSCCLDSYFTKLLGLSFYIRTLSAKIKFNLS